MATTAKAKRKTARDHGVPDEYLGEGGNFRPGMDARLKSDLIAAVLGLDNGKALHAWEPRAAKALLRKRGWTGFLDRKREILAAKKKARAAK